MLDASNVVPSGRLVTHSPGVTSPETLPVLAEGPHCLQHTRALSTEPRASGPKPRGSQSRGERAPASLAPRGRSSRTREGGGRVCKLVGRLQVSAVPFVAPTPTPRTHFLIFSRVISKCSRVYTGGSWGSRWDAEDPIQCPIDPILCVIY